MQNGFSKRCATVLKTRPSRWRYHQRPLDYHCPYLQMKFPLKQRRLGAHRILLDHQDTRDLPNPLGPPDPQDPPGLPA